jgi:hypothetical protein
MELIPKMRAYSSELTDLSAIFGVIIEGELSLL